MNMLARKHLIEKGYLKQGSTRNIWEIRDAGRKQYGEWLDIIKRNLPPGENKCL